MMKSEIILKFKKVRIGATTTKLKKHIFNFLDCRFAQFINSLSTTYHPIKCARGCIK